MVVLESGGMHTSPGNQYLQPDYLSPLPTTLDAKKSPLALLAQTCSQIGADSPSKPLISPLDKISKKLSSNSDRTAISPSNNNNNTNNTNYNMKTLPDYHKSESKVAFKPYENNIVSKKSEPPRPASKNGSVDSYDERRSESRSSSRKSVSPQQPATEKSAEPRKSASPATSGSGASPIIRSGLEVLQGHSKDLGLAGFKQPLGVNPLCCPPELDPTNPAFRPPFAGGPFSQHHAAAAMLAASGFPSAANPSPYLSYARVKTPAGGEALIPVCKDPYCTGCQLSLAHNSLSGAGACPSGCTQCDHQKYNLAAAAALSMVSPPHPLAYQLGRPYVCSWIVGDNYCGKRFGTSDELLQHLRTHTSSAESSSLMNSMRYPPSPVSPLSGARYHPYSKPGLPPASSPFSAFNPTLGPYYSPYALYGQRLGAAVHP